MERSFSEMRIEKRGRKRERRGFYEGKGMENGSFLDGSL